MNYLNYLKPSDTTIRCWLVCRAAQLVGKTNILALNLEQKVSTHTSTNYS